MVRGQVSSLGSCVMTNMVQNATSFDLSFINSKVNVSEHGRVVFHLL